MKTTNDINSTPASFPLFGLTYLVIGGSLLGILVSKLGGQADRQYSILVAGAAAAAGWIWGRVRYGRLRAEGKLEIQGSSVQSTVPDNSQPESKAELQKSLRRVFDSETEDSKHLLTCTRGHHLRAFPVVIGGFGALVAFIVLFSPAVPGTTSAAAGAVSLAVAALGMLWKNRFTLDLQEKTLTTKSVFTTKTTPLRTIGVNSCWLLATQNNYVILQRSEYLFVFDGSRMTRLTPCEKPERNLDSVAAELARSAGTGFARGPVSDQKGQLVPSSAALVLDWWVICLPLTFIAAMVLLQALQPFLTAQ